MSKVKLLLLTIGLLVGISSQSFAQSGKITGKIIDATTGETLPGANVVIDGTTRGVQTDIDGNYLLLNVPPGTYTIVVSYIGYSAQRVNEVIVRTDLTTELNFKLKEEIFEGEEIVVQAERALIIKDLTSSEARVSSEEIQKLPVQELQDVVQLQAGVNVGNDGAIHIRGGRASEVSYVVDGIRVTDNYNRSQGLRVENQAVQELQVISGTFNAEHGQAMSGIINVVTKSGSNVYDANVSMWGGSYLTAHGARYDGIPNAVQEFNPMDQYNLSASVSGPIVKDKLTFFATARKFRNDGWLKGYNAFSYHGAYRDTVPMGTDLNAYRDLYNQSIDLSSSWISVDTIGTGSSQRIVIRDSGKRDSSIVDANPFDTQSFLANFQYSPFAMLKFNIIGSYGKEQGRGYDHANRLVPGGSPSFYNENYSVNFKTTITPSSSTYIVFNAAYRVNTSDSYLFKDPYDPRFFNYQNIEVFDIQNPGQAYQYNQVNSSNNIFSRGTESVIAKVELSSQLNKQHFIKAGVEYQMDNVRFENINLQPLDAGQGIVIPDYIPVELQDKIELGIAPINTTNYQKYDRSPSYLSAFLQDKIEFEKLIINIGFRFDYFNPNTQIAADPKDPDIYNPTLASNIYNDINSNGVFDAGDTEVTLEDRQAYWWKDADAKYQISPRLGIAYPISEKGLIYFSYGYFFQMPSYENLYTNSQIILPQSSGIFGLFGNPNLKPERSTQYELGLKQEIAAGTAIEVTGFYKDSRDYVSSGTINETYNPTVRYATFINRDYASSKGLTVAVNQDLGGALTLGVDYTYTTVEGSNSNPADEFSRALSQGNESGQSLTKFIRPLNWDRSHVLNGTLFYASDTWGGNVVGRFYTGTPYTPGTPFTVRYGPTASQRDLTNTARLPNRLTFDLNLYKNFKIGKTEIRTYANIFNLLDSEIINAVYSDSGIPSTPLVVPSTANPDYLENPSWFGEPRRIQIGFSVSL
ncbi:TonB-dependent receptor [bacterium]|nr:MAG: TonB-dependent receptor [bacterium]